MLEAQLVSTLKAGRQQHESGNLAEAEQLYRQVLAEHPTHYQALHLLGILYGQAGRHAEAADFIGRSLATNTHVISAEAYFNYGIALSALGSVEKAVAAFRRAIELKPRYTGAYGNLGVALARLGRFDEAIAAYRAAIDIQPDFAEAYNDLGNAYRVMGWMPQAIGAFQSALRIKPNMVEVQNNLGIAYKETGRLEEAITCLRAAITLRPDLAESHWNLAISLLVRGDFAAGWPEYEWRWKCKQFEAERRPLPQPRWDGGDLTGRTVLVRCEQGLGDAIHFIRYIPLVLARGGRVIVECQPDLIRLLQQIPGVAQWVSRGQALPAYDVHCYLLDLPRILGTTLETIPSQGAPLAAPADLTRAWQERVAARGPGLKVGLA